MAHELEKAYHPQEVEKKIYTLNLDLKNRIIKIELEDTDTKKHRRVIAIHKKTIDNIKCTNEE